MTSELEQTADNQYFEDLRKKEFSILDEQSQVYLDFTGANLCPNTLLQQHFDLLKNSILGNPHSTNPSSQLATQLVEDTRAYIKEFFNAQDYECIFTTNASAALKIIGEGYPFDEQSQFVILSDNHNSVNGIREFCNNKKGTTHYVPVDCKELTIDNKALLDLFENSQNKTNKLFAFPAQSNVSGIKHSLEWIDIAQKYGYDVLLDAAAYVPTSKLDLKLNPADFVSVSFYKMFGYPTGLGCLLVKKSKFDKLRKPWFAGGTVTMVSVVFQKQFLAHGHERFEDGTLNYNNIPSIKNGLQFLNQIGYEKINLRVKNLIQYIYNSLIELKHDNGLPLVKIFGTHDFNIRGGNFILNFFDAEGQLIHFHKFEKIANEKRISIRYGCFCNPGIDEMSNEVTPEEMVNYFTDRSEGDYDDIVNYLGKMRGAIRVSVGIATVKADLDKFLELAKSLKNNKVAQLL